MTSQCAGPQSSSRSQYYSTLFNFLKLFGVATHTITFQIAVNIRNLITPNIISWKLDKITKRYQNIIDWFLAIWIWDLATKIIDHVINITKNIFFSFMQSFCILICKFN